MKNLIKTTLFALGLSLASSAMASNYLMRVMIPNQPVTAAPAPELLSLNPGVVPISGETITVNGQYFSPTDTAQINGVNAASSVSSTSQMSVTAPGVSSAGYVPLTVSGANKALDLIYEDSTPAYSIGAYGSGPWGAFPGWPAAADSADWLYANSGYDSAPGSTDTASPAVIETNALTVDGSYVYDNTTGADIAATLYATGDNAFVALLNGQQVLYGDNWDETFSGPITLKPGNNLLQVESLNYGSSPNPSGLIAAVLSASGSVLFETNSGWVVGSASAN
ncbi:IPT/TIG domain-containing protein [Acidithiobacillus thiooxidans]|uniref:IPT/TIG domain-containing protein n=1 Tax=Acidithiobacillus thiooxidans TaxID=930 RepID=UPI0004E22D24|nr:IPT/TIG domain-containing protein [Acidithiobacillus thiooxidans]